MLGRKMGCFLVGMSKRSFTRGDQLTCMTATAEILFLKVLIRLQTQQKVKV